MQVPDVEPARGMATNRELGDLARLVRRVVEDLDLEPVVRIIHFADRIDQPIRHVHFVVNRKLDRDRRTLAERWRRDAAPRGLVAVFHVKINEIVPMPAVDREDAQDEKIQDENKCFRQRHKEAS